ncbi:unnamed protein product [Cochlearia groenlandica]
MSEMSSCQEAKIVDLDADDDESKNLKHESESHVNCETTVLNADEKESVKDEEASTSTRELNRKRPAAGTLLDGEPIINLPPKLEADSRSQFKDTPVNPVVTFCGHVFCYQCVSKYIKGDENMCPVRRCREDLARDVVFSEYALRNCIKDDLGCSSSHDEGLDTSVLLNSEFVSSKIKAVLDILESHSKQGIPNNAHHGEMPSSSESDDDDDVTNVEPMNFRRLDGTMSLAARDEAVKEFCNDPDEDKRKMIASAFGEEHGGSGTRLTVADLNYLFKV